MLHSFSNFASTISAMPSADPFGTSLKQSTIPLNETAMICDWIICDWI